MTAATVTLWQQDFYRSNFYVAAVVTEKNVYKIGLFKTQNNFFNLAFCIYDSCMCSIKYTVQHSRIISVVIYP